MTIVANGIGLAKNAFTVRGVNAAGLTLPDKLPAAWVVDCKSVSDGGQALLVLGSYLHPNSAGAIRLLQVLHLRPTQPLGEAAAMPTRPAWRCACGQPMAVLRRRMPAEVPSDSPSDSSIGHPVVHDKPDKAGPMAARTMR